MKLYKKTVQGKYYANESQQLQSEITFKEKQATS